MLPEPKSLATMTGSKLLQEPLVSWQMFPVRNTRALIPLTRRSFCMRLIIVLKGSIICRLLTYVLFLSTNSSSEIVMILIPVKLLREPLSPISMQLLSRAAGTSSATARYSHQTVALTSEQMNFPNYSRWLFQYTYCFQLLHPLYPTKM